MALAIDITHGCGLNNEARHYLLLKKSKIILYLLFILQYRPFNQLYITNNTERFNFKSGCAVHNAKLTKTDWLVVLQLEFWLDTNF